MAYYTLILLTAVILLIFLTLLLRKLQYMVTFQPRSEIQETPAVLNLAYDNITFKDASGNTISGWFVKAPDNDKTILFCHGSGGNLSHRVDSAAAYVSLGLNFCVFDYAGYGESTGKPSEEAFYEGADAAFDYLVKTEGILPHNIIVAGRSLGGAPAALLARHYSTGGLILESSIYNFGMAAHDRLKIILPGFLLRYSFDTRKILSSVNCPVLLIASRDDTVVKFRNSSKLLETAPPGTELIELSGDHDDCYFFCRQRYLDALKDFISRI
ncbi:alpha/beta hydrolase [Lentisphaerota bacterium ZTH]|nr:alpha/beta hydrolase [Lentisphaerota bacterium]WET06114.1 alpha/beta hydrolase [Lentisphaerota bacterium ZTH]